MKRVLVTGASGFIGSHCVPALAARGFEVHAVSRRPRKDSNCTWHEADLFEQTARQSLFEDVKPSHLLHLAWTEVAGDYQWDASNLRWPEASAALLGSFAQNGGRRAVFVGSCAEYEYGPAPLCESTTRLAPLTLYAASKAALSHLLPVLGTRSGVSTCWARLFYLYGPGEPTRRVLPSVLASLLRNRPIDCTAGDQIRDFIYVSDAADALATLIDSDLEGEINVASGKPMTLRHLLEQFGEYLSVPQLLHFGARAMSANEPPCIIAETSRLNQELGWRPSHALSEAVSLTSEWWRTTLGK